MDKKDKKVGTFGTIEVTILETKGAKCSHCAATVESIERYTKVKKNNKSQQFEETLSFPVNREQSCVKITVYKKPLIGSDKPVGVISFPIKDLQSTPGEKSPSQWYKLSPPKSQLSTGGDIVIAEQSEGSKDVGEVRLQFLYTPPEVKEVEFKGIVLEGCWDDKTNGGNIINNIDWLKNTQYLLTVGSASSVSIVLHNKEAAAPQATFYVLKYDDDFYKGKLLTFFSNDDIVKAGDNLAPVFGSHVEFTHKLSEGTYIVIPCFYTKLEDQVKEDGDETAVWNYVIAANADPIQRISFAKVDPEGWRKLTKVNSWTEDNCGGSDVSAPSWSQNPQYFFNLREKGEVSVVLNHADAKLSVGFQIMQYSDPDHKAICYQDEVAKSKTFDYSVSVGVNIPRMKAGRYCIIPCTYEVDQQGEFELSVFTADPKAKLKEIEGEWEYKRVAKAAWDKDTAGGSPNNDTFLSNPQFYLKLTPKGEDCCRDFVIQLTQHRTKKSEVDVASIGVYVLAPKDDDYDNDNFEPRKAEVDDLEEEFVLTKTDGFSANRVVYCYGTVPDDVEVGNYIVIPSTFDPDMYFKFNLAVYTDCEVAIKEINDEEEDEEEEDEE